MKKKCVYCEDGTVVDVLYISDHPSNKVNDGVVDMKDCEPEDVDAFFRQLNKMDPYNN